MKPPECVICGERCDLKITPPISFVPPDVGHHEPEWFCAMHHAQASRDAATMTLREALLKFRQSMQSHAQERAHNTIVIGRVEIRDLYDRLTNILTEAGVTLQMKHEKRMTTSGMYGESGLIEVSETCSEATHEDNTIKLFLEEHVWDIGTRLKLALTLSVDHPQGRYVLVADAGDKTWVEQVSVFGKAPKRLQIDQCFARI